jgi:predicted Rossmann fold nucleotide-binding protein DprA/Smf involved in DNA uptake
VAIVGARHADAYALEVAQRFRAVAGGGPSPFRFRAGSTARPAPPSGRGRTVAVLGCGLAVDYPQRHAALRNAMPSAARC